MRRTAVLVLLTAAATGALALDTGLATGILSSLGPIRPANTVIRSVQAAAPQFFVSFPELMRSWGYPLETHTARTEDGFLLTLHRIPRGRLAGDAASRADDAAGAPVLLQHGMVSCSEFWVVGGPGVAPALTLADRGYDVWLGNFRGNHFSRKHEKLGRREKRMWMFSFHEMGLYDVPATIDYVLNATQKEKLFYIGHSMGNTAFYVAASMRPEYNERIRLQVALAPAVYLNESNSALLQVAVANTENIKVLLDALPTYELLHKTDANIAFTYLTCNEGANKLCAIAVSSIVGSIDLNNSKYVSMLLGRTTSSTSALVLWHFAQMIRSGEFVQLDYGARQNLQAYGQARPPRYPLEKVTAPVALYASRADALVTPKGTDRLARELPNLVLYKVIDDKFFNHLEYVFHPQLNKLLMDDVLKTMARF